MVDIVDPFASPKAETEIVDPFAEHSPRPTGRERQRSYLESVREGATSSPAGREASGPDLSSERGTAGEIASEFGDIGKGVAKGVPAMTGIPGDIEAGARGIINAFAPPNAPVVERQPNMPTTAEGGIFGPRIMGQYALINPPANPREAFGMQVPGMLLGTKFAKTPELPPELPTVPPGGPVAIPRPRTGTLLLPPDVPHTLPPLPPGTSTVGASATSPLAGYNADTLSYLKRRLQASPNTEFTLDERLEGMSPHQTLAEFDPNTESIFGGLATKPNAKNEIVNTFEQRNKERPERVKNLFDDTFGETQNLYALQQARIAEAKKAVDPLYQQFRSERIPPPQTAEMHDAFYAPVSGLMDRLRAAGAFGMARFKAGVEGVPWENAFGGYGPIPEGKWPTSQSWDYVKRALDQKIQNSFTSLGKATDNTRLFQQLKNDMMALVDNDVWRQARQTYATPRQISDAENLGRKFFRMDKDEMPALLSDFNDAQKAGFLRGVRKEIDNQMGGVGNADMTTVRKVLSPNVVEKLDSIIGPNETGKLVRGLEHEVSMTASGSRITGRGQSITADRTAAGREWDPREMVSPSSSLVRKGISHGTELVAHPLEKGREVVTALGDRMLLNRAQRIWEESARIGTLQGPERDAVLRYLLTPEQSQGGRVIRRASGGRVNHFDPKSIGARKNPRDGNYYLPGKKPGTWFKVVPRHG